MLMVANPSGVGRRWKERSRSAVGLSAVALLIPTLFYFWFCADRRVDLQPAKTFWALRRNAVICGTLPSGHEESDGDWTSAPTALGLYQPHGEGYDDEQLPVVPHQSQEDGRSHQRRQQWEAERQRLVSLIKRHAKLQQVHRSGHFDAASSTRLFNSVDDWHDSAAVVGLRSVVYSCKHGGFCGGLADRLHGSIVLYYVALMSNRSFFIDWKKPSRLDTYYTPRASTRGHGRNLDWRISTLTKQEVSEELTSSERRYFQQRDDTPDCDKLVAMALDPSGPQILRVTTNHAKACVARILRRELRFQHAPPDAMGLAFRWLFEESALLSETVSRVTVEQDWDSKHGICLHIRHGGKMGADTQPGQVIEGIRHHDMAPFWSCAKAVSSGVASKRGETSIPGFSDKCRPDVQKWLLVSDDDALLEEAKLKLPQPAFLSHTRSLGQVLHIDKLGHYRKTQSLESTLHGELRVFVDHALLRRCRVLLASHSSFSLSAAGSSTVLEQLYLVNRMRPQAHTGDNEPCSQIHPYKFW
eukprot:scpid24707/ scgid16220/ 